jgi:peptide/nickel transport system ATP-binding protein/oligopeptide transport system ATP-binding protein
MIELDQISKTYHSGFFSKKETLAVDHVSFSIARGETFGLIGESGCGKTTLGRILLRLVEPSSGTVRFDGVELTTLSKRELRRFRPRMQIVFQDPDTSLNPRMTIGRCVAEPLEIWRDLGHNETTDRVLELLELVGLQPDLISRYPFELSGGQKQRVALARALTLDPEFIVADEPTAALDLSVQAQVLDLLRNIQRRRNLTLLFISHDPQVIRRMADRVAVMNNGRILEIQKTSTLFTDPQDPYTRHLVAAAYEGEAWFGKDRLNSSLE